MFYSCYHLAFLGSGCSSVHELGFFIEILFHFPKKCFWYVLLVHTSLWQQQASKCYNKTWGLQSKNDHDIYYSWIDAEHMLFMGSTKFPDENEVPQFPLDEIFAVYSEFISSIIYRLHVHFMFHGTMHKWNTYYLKVMASGNYFPS